MALILRGEIYVPYTEVGVGDYGVTSFHGISRKYQVTGQFFEYFHLA